jgi:hypothetical protein
MAFDLAAGRIVLFGGATDWTGASAVVLNDTWEWDGTNWTKRNPTASPPPRHYHAMTYDLARGAIVVFGGRSTINGTALSDAWEWSSSANTWRQIMVTGASITLRDFPSFAHDYVRGRDVAVGGWASGTRYSDTWELLPGVPFAGTQSYGTGCGGSAGVPVLTAIGVPKLGNAAFALQLSSARTNAAAALLMSEAQDNIAIGGGCALLVGAPVFSLGTVTDGAGTVSWPLPVANNPAWLGIELYTQHVVADPVGAFSGVASFSNGQLLRIGN